MSQPTDATYRSYTAAQIGSLYHELVSQVAAANGTSSAYTSTNLATIVSELGTARDAVLNALIANNDSGNP